MYHTSYEIFTTVSLATKTLHKHMNKLKLYIVLVFILGISGCETVSNSLNSVSNATSWVPNALEKSDLVYKPTISQGNIITQKQVNQLKPGMTKKQVKFLLGTPTLRDVFHENRWDYPFTEGKGSNPDKISYFSVLFEDDRLVRLFGDIYPKPNSETTSSRAKPVIKVPDWKPSKKTSWESLKDTFTW